MSAFFKVFSISLLCFLSACVTYKGDNNPVARKFGWFDYVAGNDIRKVCGQLGADRYRFVYNGVYQWQTRSYDVFFISKKLKINVTGKNNLTALRGDDLLAPWRGQTAEVTLTDKLLSDIKKTLKESVALHHNEGSDRLYSDQFYWVVSACLDGKFILKGFKWSSKSWDGMVFDDLLLAVDVTDVPVEKPRVLSPLDVWESVGEADPFLIEIRENRMVGF